MAAFVLVAFKELIISLLFGKIYAQAESVVGLLAVYSVFASIFMYLKVYSGLIEKTYLPFISIFVGFLFNIGLNIVLIPRFNIVGAAYASIISFSLILVIILFFNKKKGMSLKFDIIIICIMPLILLFNLWHALFWLLILAGGVTMTEFILTEKEKTLLRLRIKTNLWKRAKFQ
jgi:O-antigen/teichoic acid export membrane protein